MPSEYRNQKEIGYGLWIWIMDYGFWSYGSNINVIIYNPSNEYIANILHHLFVDIGINNKSQC